jgi:nitroimidazol reductase NimA-like FMN-containing flavoprotein (pyridoxamine 5'-phosphate oxidase superfamily)
MSPAKKKPIPAVAAETPLAPARPGDVEFRELSTDEIQHLLQANHVGRLAFSLHDRVDIQPIHYVYDRGWLYGRTSVGQKSETLRHNQWVAFEVDEVSDTFNWRSVVVHGSFWILHPRGSQQALDLWAKAAELVSTVVPGSLTETDPVAFRQTLFRIAVNDARGRAAKHKIPDKRSV